MAEISKSLPKYRFYIKSRFGTEKLEVPPLEWKSGEYELDRDILKGGVTQQFNSSSLSFVKDGADRLDSLFYSDGVNAEAYLIIAWLNFETQSYVEFPTLYTFKFNKWKKQKRGRLLATNILVKKPGLLQKIEDRSGTDVDVTNNYSIEGLELVDYDWFSETFEDTSAVLVGGSGFALGATPTYSTIDIATITASDFAEVQIVTGQQNPSKARSIFLESLEDRTILVTGSIDFSCEILGSGSATYTLRVIIYSIGGIEVSDSFLDQVTISNGTTTGTLTIDSSFDLTEGQSACIVGGFSAVTSVDDELFWTTSDITLTQEDAPSKSSPLNAIKFPETLAFLRGSMTGLDGYVLGIGSFVTLDINSFTVQDFDELQIVGGSLSPSKANSFFFESLDARALLVIGSIDLNILAIDDVTVQLRAIIYDSSGSQTGSYLIETETIAQGVTEKTMDISGTFDILETHSACLVIGISSSSSVDDEVSWLSSSIIVKEEIIQTNEIITECYPDYELFERCLQKITDRQFPLYTEKFGRPDVSYNYAGDKYTSESQDSLSVTVNGITLRGDTLTSEDNSLPVNWDDLFQTRQSQYNIGWGVEEIEGEERVVIKDYIDFFQTNIVKDFSDQLTFLDIESEITESIIFNELETGNDNYDYEELNGRGEYNVDSNFSTILNVSNTFDNKAVYREDTRGITTLLEKNESGLTTTDTDSDSDIFCVKVQRETEDNEAAWKAETNENIIVENDSSLFETGSLNLLWSPIRKLIRSAGRWTTGVVELSSKARFQSSSKSQTLETTGEGYTVIENDDITMNDISLSLFKPIKHTFEVVITWQDIFDIHDDPYAKVRATSDITGWILNLKKKNNEDKALITIIEAK